MLDDIIKYKQLKEEGLTRREIVRELKCGENYLKKLIDQINTNKLLDKPKYYKITQGLSFGIKDYYYDWEF